MPKLFLREPLARDIRGVIRIGGTRVSLDSVVSAYRDAASVPELAEAFPDVSLSDLHATVAYYLNHRAEVDEYLDQRRKGAAAIEERIRRDFPRSYRRQGPRQVAPSSDESQN